ncbi:IPT/TIG domain-containing protein [Myxococcota bacterium]|nr:IPT/TIG domain-containing protein [Myxococcota bacterium]
MLQRIFAITAFALTLFPVSTSWGFMDFTHIKPYEGPWGGKVIIYGKNFETSTVKVYYNNVVIKPIKVTRGTITIEIPDGTKSGWIEVEQGSRRLRAPKRFIIKNKTILKSIEPNAGPPQTWITARGLFFEKTTRFYLGYMSLPVKYVSYREVKVFIPKGLKGGFISHTSFGKKIGTRIAYTVKPLPLFSRFSPTTAWIQDKVVLQGKNFCKDLKVKLGDISMPVQKKSSNTATVLVPRGSKTAPVTLWCFGRSFPSGNNLTIKAPYGIITAVEPKASPPGRWVTLTGEGLTAQDKFWIGQRVITRVRNLKANKVEVFIPNNARTDIFHHRSYGRIRPTSVVLIIDYPPVISGFSPATGWYGTKVTLKGRHLCPDARVRIGTTELPNTTVSSRTGLTFSIPTMLSGGPVSVTCRNWTATSRGSFTLKPTTVAITSISPEEGPPGTEITIRGRNFPSDMKLLWNNTALSLKVIDHTLARATIRGRGKGSLRIYAYRRYYSSKSAFTVAWPKPQPLSFGPKTNWHRGTITIEGKKFCSSPVVHLVHPKAAWRKQVLKILRRTEGSITALLPEKTFSGTLTITCYRFTVKVPGGPISLAPPVGNIASIYPNFGPPGTLVTINGARFRKDLSFYLGNAALSRRFISPSQIQVRIPQGAATGSLFVQTGRTRVKTSFVFRVGYPQPVVASVTPDMGWISDKMTIRGRNFCPDAQVQFPGAVKARVTSRISHTILHVMIPRGAQSGYLKVICPKTSGTARGWFTMAPPYARIHQISPTLACPGDTILISGVNFNKRVRFYLGSQVMPAKIINSNKAEAMVPVGARSGDVKVASFGRTLPTTQSIIIKSRICKSRRK